MHKQMTRYPTKNKIHESTIEQEPQILKQDELRWELTFKVWTISMLKQLSRLLRNAMSAGDFSPSNRSINSTNLEEQNQACSCIITQKKTGKLYILIQDED